jgi:type II secretory pathway component PulM
MVVDKKVKVGFWMRLQPRERVMIMALAGVFFSVGIAVLVFLRMDRLSAIDAEIDEIARATDLVYTQGVSYGDKVAHKSKREAKISDKPLLFASLIENAESLAEVSASNQEEMPPFDVSEDLKQRSIQFDLRSVSLGQLTKFLATVEAPGEHVVLTHRLEVRSLSAAEDRLNAAIELATWERVAVAASEPAEEDAP